MEWLSVKECIGLVGLPSDPSNVRARLNKAACDETRRKRQGSKAFEYHISVLPEETQAHIHREQTKAEIAARAEQAKAIREKFADEKAEATQDEKLADMALMDGWSEERKTRCLIRHDVIAACEDYIRNVKAIGIGRTQATRDFVDMFNAKALPFEEKVYRILHSKLSDASVRRWRKKYREGGIAALDSVQSTRKGQYTIEVQPEMKQFALSFISEFPHTTGSKLYQAINVEFKNSDLRLPCKSGSQRWLKWWKEQNASLFESIRNPDAWKNNYLAAFGDASEGINCLNQLWELDATPADLELTLPDGSKRRYHLTGLIDVYSRTPMLLVTETPRTESNAALLRRGILKHGKPYKVKIDNGTDYVSHGMMLVLDTLDIEYDVCPPFSPWKKPHIERFFRHFSHDLLELKPGFVGHNVAERKGIEARKTFAERLMKKDEIIDVTMTPEELQTFCDEWIQNIYMHKVHSGLDATPFEVVNQYQGSIEKISNERALDQLLSVPTKGGLRTVNKQGIKVDGITYIEAELGLHIGQQVQIRYDKDDLGQIVVSSLEGEFICIAVNPEYQGIDRMRIAQEAKRLQKEHIKQARKEIQAARRKFKPRDIADKIMDDAREQASNLVAMPKSGNEYTNTAIEGAAQAADALEDIEQESPKEMAWEQREAMRKIVKGEAETDKTRFCRWLDLNKRVEDGKELDEVNQHWKANYEQTPEFKGNYMVWEDFGDRAFR